LALDLGVSVGCGLVNGEEGEGEQDWDEKKKWEKADKGEKQFSPGGVLIENEVDEITVVIVVIGILMVLVFDPLPIRILLDNLQLPCLYVPILNLLAPSIYRLPPFFHHFAPLFQ
jgi:hypothetical protein